MKTEQLIIQTQANKGTARIYVNARKEVAENFYRIREEHPELDQLEVLKLAKKQVGE